MSSNQERRGGVGGGGDGVDIGAWLLEQHEFARLHEETLQSSPNAIYSVANWLHYIDAVEDQIMQERQNLQTVSKSKPHNLEQSDDSNSVTLRRLVEARDWVGRRAVHHLPRSFKLWKLQWEFLLSLQKSTQSKSQLALSLSLHKTIQACFERALRTLSSYPRVWIVYLQWLISLLKEQPQQQQSTELKKEPAVGATDKMMIAVVDLTFLRRTMNRALQSVAVAQHAKLWDGTGIIELLLSISQFQTAVRTEKDNDDTMDESEFSSPSSLLSFIPWESAHTLLRRYALWRHCLDASGTSAGSSNASSNFGLDYAIWCEAHEKWGEAAVAYQTVLNSHADSESGASFSNSNNLALALEQEQAWQSFTQLVAHHSDAVERVGIPWELILQTAIQQQIVAQEQQGRSSSKNDGLVVDEKSNNTSTLLGLLYAWLASAWIQRGNLEMAVTVYEDGLQHVRTVRDFAVLYAAYLSLTEGVVTALSESIFEDENVEGDDETKMQTEDDDNDWDLLVSGNTTSSSTSATTGNQLAEMELAISRAEHLTARRPLLLNAVVLRQNVHNCAAWMERADLYVALDQPRQAAAALEDGLQQIQQGSGKNAKSAGTASLSHVVLRLVKVYTDSLNDVNAARDLLDRVCRQRTTALGFAQATDLAECWAAWIELELSHEAWDEALSLARQSVAGEPKQVQQRHNHASSNEEGGIASAVQSKPTYRRLNLTRLLRLWDLLLDLEESLGTVQTTKDAYNRALELKVATVPHVLNFATFLTEQKFFEESFTVYERGLELFGFPHAGAKLLWKAYLTSFLQRYRGSKIERTRNLLQRCLDECPAEECAEFFTMSGEFEEQYGFTKRALSVYRAMCDKVTAAEKYTAYQLFIVKTIQYLGVAATRDIYQDALSKLTEPVSFVQLCTDFAQMEVGLQEYDRARVIFAYGAQSADPRRLPEFWRDWNDFEVQHGSEDSFREMLRVKRSVEAAFSTVNYNASGMSDAATGGGASKPLSNDEAMRMIADGEGMDLMSDNPTSKAGSGFVPASTKRSAAAASLDEVEAKVAKLRQATGVIGTSKESTVSTATAAAAAENDVDVDEIDLDDLDAEIEAAAREGSSAAPAAATSDVTTRAAPDAVFGGLAAGITNA